MALRVVQFGTQVMQFGTKSGSEWHTKYYSKYYITNITKEVVYGFADFTQIINWENTQQQVNGEQGI
jgi:hypothetical protein